MTTSDSAALTGPIPRTLRGTPVVPGVAYGPVLVNRSQISPAALAALHGQELGPEDATARYDAAVSVVASRLADRAAAARGSAAEVLTATAGLARDPGLRTTAVGRLDRGERLLA
ncbi:MAG: phosphoenolpyruvate-utilizing N-terminal domain-containing protein, partial [Nocardioides sp.]